MDVVYVCGLPGVGKNTVLRKLIDRIKSDKKIKVVSFGDEIKEIIDARLGVIDRDRIRFDLSYEEQKTFIFETLKRIIEKYHSVDLLFLHGHSILVTPYGYLAGFPTILYQALRAYYIENPFNITLLVHIVAKPEEIMARRATDKERSRVKESIETIRKQLELSEMAMHSIAFNLFVPLVVLNNAQGKLADAVEELYETLKGRKLL